MSAHALAQFRCTTLGCARHGQVSAVALGPPAGARDVGLLAVPNVICESCGMPVTRLTRLVGGVPHSRTSHA
jgi:hypothetical protein